MLPLSTLLCLLASPQDPAPQAYTVDVTQGDDLFHVTYRPGPLTGEDTNLDFVAFAPGMHSVLHFGRFVQELTVLDADGEELVAERDGTDRWVLAEPERVDRIVYTIEDTFDTDIDEYRILPAGGTAIEDDHVLLNTFGVLAYFDRLLSEPVELTVHHDPSWLAGTALKRGKDGVFRADSWRELVDAPILMGELTTTGIFVGDIEVEIFVWSPDESLDAEQVLYTTGENLEACGAYLGFAPVDRYAFLFLFPDLRNPGKNRFRSFGALEHTTSSVYTLPAAAQSLESIAPVIAHEFMHVLSPLHLRSTIIAEFDYSIPTTDDHLWLYEGVTEWSAHILRLRAGVTELDDFLGEMRQKMTLSRRMFREDFSLARLSREWHTDEGLREYQNIYQKGALTALCLDLLILERTGGERGLREVFVDLVHRYGRPKPFDNDTFLEEFVKASHPDVAEFFERHVTGTEPLPYFELFEAVGIQFDDGVTSSSGRPQFTVWDDCSEEQLALRDVWLTNREG